MFRNLLNIFVILVAFGVFSSVVGKIPKTPSPPPRFCDTNGAQYCSRTIIQGKKEVEQKNTFSFCGFIEGCTEQQLSCSGLTQADMARLTGKCSNFPTFTSPIPQSFTAFQ